MDTLLAIYQISGENDKLLDICNKILTIDFLDYQARKNRGLILYRRGQFDDALKDFNIVNTYHPEDAECLFCVAKIFFRQGNMHGAKDYAKRAHHADSSNLKIFKFLGDIYKKLNRHYMALSAYQKILALDSQFKGIHKTIGSTLFELGEFKLALTEFNLDNNDDVEVLHYKGLCLYNLGYQKEGFQLLRKCLEKDPNFIQSIRTLGHLSYIHKKYHQAEKYLTRLVTLKVNDTTDDKILAKATRHVTNIKQTIRILDALRRRRPGLSERKPLLGLSALELTGRLTKI